MKKEVKGFIVGVTTAIFAVSGMAYAKTGSEMIEAAYNNVKIYIDGLLIDPKDPNGNTVEPFISNGTTYLPVRAVANAFGKEVDWDAETSSVIIGERNYDWLDQMVIADASSTGDENKWYPSAGGTLSDGTKYGRGLQFEIDYDAELKKDDGTVDNYINLSYSLNNQYKSFEGVIDNKNDDPSAVSLIKIYGDDELIYTSPMISSGMESTAFNIDVSGVNMLKINVEPYNADTIYFMYPYIAEARLLKK